jgi:YggT family protein
MLTEIVRLILDTLGALLGVTLLLRAYMNWVGMPGRNPLVQFAMALTDWIVRPLRRVIPSAGRLDTASLVAAYLVAIVVVALTLLSKGGIADRGFDVIFYALVQVLRWSLYMVFFLTVVHVVLSWVNPYAPVAPAVAMLTKQFLAPFQRLLPPIRNIDLSPLLLILVVNVALLILSQYHH